MENRGSGWSPGDFVRLCEGPFADFPGKVLSIDRARGLVRVMVDIFGRETEVDVPAGHLEHREP